MEILHHVWELEEARVREVQERILKTRKVAYTTVMTVMKNLTKKGYLKYKKEGVAYVYSPAQAPQSVRANLVNILVEKVFNGSSKRLIQSLLIHGNLTEKEQNEIKELINS